MTPELARELSELSYELDRRLGVFLDRKGRVVDVVVGDRARLPVPAPARAPRVRLSGLRLVSTRFSAEPLGRDELRRLTLHRLDLVVAVAVGERGEPVRIEGAHLAPAGGGDGVWEVLEPCRPGKPLLPCRFPDFIAELEHRFENAAPAALETCDLERVILVGVTCGPPRRARRSLEELKELAITRGSLVLETVLQRRERIDPRTVLGRGKLEAVLVRALELGAETLIFDLPLSPSQAAHLRETTGLKVLDRNAVILDIFARHARTERGKAAVELARLRYELPHLQHRARAHSDDAGGGGRAGGARRGPGEERLEIERRKVRERIRRLEARIAEYRAGRRVTRERRKRACGVVRIALVGYTNAGKTTLLNALSGAAEPTSPRMFSTLETRTRRVYLGGRLARQGVTCLVTDTVGFLHDLPEALKEAFLASLEELVEADLLCHVADASAPDVLDRVRTVEKVLRDLGLAERPAELVFTRADLFADAADAGLPGRLVIDATSAEGIRLLREKLAERILNDVLSARAEFAGDSSPRG